MTPARPRVFAFALALLATGQAWSQADAPLVADPETSADTIVEIRVEGKKRVELEAVKRALRNKEGRPFDPLRTGDDLKSLWALNYFADIQLLVQRLPKGIAYVVRVTERPSSKSTFSVSAVLATRTTRMSSKVFMPSSL